jgi:hypothetical protein
MKPALLALTLTALLAPAFSHAAAPTVSAERYA